MAWVTGGKVTDRRNSLQGPEAKVWFLALGPGGRPGCWGGCKAQVGGLAVLQTGARMKGKGSSLSCGQRGTLSK